MDRFIEFAAQVGVAAVAVTSAAFLSMTFRASLPRDPTYSDEICCMMFIIYYIGGAVAVAKAVSPLQWGESFVLAVGITLLPAVFLGFEVYVYFSVFATVFSLAHAWSKPTHSERLE